MPQLRNKRPACILNGAINTLNHHMTQWLFCMPAHAAAICMHWNAFQFCRKRKVSSSSSQHYNDCFLLCFLSLESLQQPFWNHKSKSKQFFLLCPSAPPAAPAAPEAKLITVWIKGSEFIIRGLETPLICYRLSCTCSKLSIFTELFLKDVNRSNSRLKKGSV